MPTKKAKKSAKEHKKKGHSPYTQASEFVREEMHEAKRKGRNPKQAIAIGLSEARQAGVKVPGKKKATKKATKKKTSKKKASKSR